MGFYSFESPQKLLIDSSIQLLVGPIFSEMKLYLLKLQFCIISHNSPTSEVGVALVGSPIVLVPFTIDAKDSIALIPLLTEFQELNSKLENSKLKQELYRVIRVKCN